MMRSVSALLSIFLFTVCANAQKANLKLYYKEKGKWVEILPISSKDKSGRYSKDRMSFAFDFGRIVPGQNQMATLSLGSNFNDQSYSTISLSGSGDFAKSNDSCSGGYVGIGGLCTFDLTYTPSSIGKDSGSATVTVTNHYPPPTPPNNFNVTFYYNGSSYEETEDCSSQASGSIVYVSKQVLSEVVPVVGTDMSMYYSSEYAPEYVTDTSDFSPLFSFNFEGWTNSLQHYYDYEQHRLFLGTGSAESKNYKTLSSGYLLVTSSNGNEVYIFEPNGKHIETRTALTGALIYSFGYDGNSRLITITDAFSKVITFTRHISTGKITSITGPYGQVTTFTVGLNGRFDTITNPNSETYSMTYKSGTTGLLATFTKPGTQVSTFTYDANGRLKKDLGNGGNFWDIVLGVGGAYTNSSQMNRTTSYATSMGPFAGKIRQETTPYGFVSTYTEYPNGDTFYSAPGKWNQTSNVADERYGSAMDRLNSTTLNRNGNSSTTSHAQNVTYGVGITPDLFNFSTLTKTATTNGRVTTQAFNNSTKVETTTTPEGATSSVTLNSNEKPISVQTGSDTATTITYDGDGRLSTTIQGALNQYTYAYNAAGFLQSITNALSEVTSYVYDLAGRVTSVTLPDTRVIQYAYDSNGNLTGVTPPSKPIHNFTFNAAELMSEYQPPTLSGVLNVNTQYSYNMDKQLTQITRPTGQTVAYNYNATTGLLSTVVQASGTDTYYYNANTNYIYRIVSAQSNFTNYFGYYGDDSIVSAQELRHTPSSFLFARLSYGFDTDHRRTSRVLRGNAASPTSTTTTVYNDDDAPVQIGSMDLDYSYPSGRLSTTDLDKISDSRVYDAYGNLDQYEATYNPVGGPVTSLYSYDLTRDTLHRITGKTETIQGVTTTYAYTYDSVGRLSTVTRNGSAYSSYTYDSNGNRVSGTRAGAAFTATFDDQDRQLTYNTKTYTYNENGDRTQKVDGLSTTSYSYNALGRLLSMTLPSSTPVLYYYNGMQQFVASRVGGVLGDIYIYEDDNKIGAHVTSAGVYTAEYRFGTHVNTPDQFIKSGNTHRIITDHLGSPRLVVRVTDGVVMQRMDYDEFGVVTNDTAPGFQRYGYAGGIYLAEDQLVMFGARYYDAETGRWTTKDPIRFDGGDSNLYGYVMNDPINFIDPYGTYSMSVRIAIVATGVTAYVGYNICKAYWDRYNSPREKSKRDIQDVLDDYIKNNPPSNQPLPPLQDNRPDSPGRDALPSKGKTA